MINIAILTLFSVLSHGTEHFFKMIKIGTLEADIFIFFKASLNS